MLSGFELYPRWVPLPQDKAGPQTWYQRVLDERTLNAPDVKKSFECLKGAFESILFRRSI